MLRFGLLILSASFIGAIPGDDVKVVQDKNSVVSSRLEGRWEADPELWPRLAPRGKANATFSFKHDATVASRLPQWFKDKAAEYVVYECGVSTMGGKDYPSIVTSHTGNPVIIFFRERDGDPMGDGESSLVMLAPAKETSNDILFLGGDVNNEPFRPFRRVKE